MRKFAIATVMSLAASTSFASDMPRFDVEGYCNEVSAFGGDFSNTLYNSCIDMEQSAYSELKGSWGDLPARMKNHCTAVAGAGGTGSYTLLKSCVDMEVSAAKNKSTFSYD